MKFSSTAIAVKCGAVSFLLCVLLFADGIVEISPGFIGSALREISVVCWDASTQWMLVFCLSAYCVVLLNVGPRAKSEAFCLRPANPNLWLAAFLSLSLLRYALAYDSAFHSMGMAVLLTAIVFGKTLATWVHWQGDGSSSFTGQTGMIPSLLGERTEEGVSVQPFAGFMEQPKDGRRPLVAVHRKEIKLRAVFLVRLLVWVLVLSACWQPEKSTVFQYHGGPRWSGVWGNPNLYGLLVGVGIVLAAGQIVQSLQFTDGRQKKRFCVLLFLFAAILCGIGLLKSYSRGAWLAVFAGLLFMAVQIFKCFQFSIWFRRNWFSLALLTTSVLLSVFWQFRFTEQRPAERLFSAANVNDFSWRNRLIAWEGAVRMMKDKPLAGFGWGQAETAYGTKYCPPRVNNESGAIEMNDYLMIGISAGVPAMVCFFIYIALSLRGKQGRSDSPSAICHPPSPIVTTCRAGAIVLLVGFWFDGGLFKLPVAVVFWTLLELSRIETFTPLAVSSTQETTVGERVAIMPVVPNHGAWKNRLRRVCCFPAGVASGVSPDAKGVRPAVRVLPRAKAPDAARLNRYEIALRWVVAILTTWALTETGFHLVPPHCLISERTLSIARRILVRPKERADFETLAGQPIWRGQKLGTLLTHVELANYNRELINWQLDATNYENYVLSPVITGTLDERFDWRRLLWEEFYPRIRHENSPQDAVQIVVRHLRERVTIANEPNLPHDIPTIWLDQLTDETGFQIIYVASLRSVGVPARLDSNHHAEFWDGSKWSLAPSPAVTIW